MVTVNELKEFMKDILDIHGQFDNETLMDKTYHTKYLDKFGGKEILDLKDLYGEKFIEYKNIKNLLKQNYGDDKEKQRKIDLLKYQLNEINIANLKIGEEEKLEENRKIMVNSEKIADSLNTVENNLSENAIDAINESIRSLEKIDDIDEKYFQKLSELKGIYYEVQEFTRDICGIKDNVYFDEEERNNIENRLDIIYELKRKYGNSIEEILNYKEDLEKEIDKIENLEQENNKLKSKLETLKVEMIEVSNKITEIREKKAKELNKKINEELHDLDMQNSKFNAKIIQNEDFTDNGLSHVEFMISTNIGDEEKNLNKIASGGEMSRMMLAIKNVLADIDEVPILVFDEVDTGISGKAANMVGKKLRQIAKKHQVLVVTHLATIAAKGEYNYYIYKKVEDNRTSTKVKQLTEEETITEIARIASGEITEITLSHAEALRNTNVA